MASTGRFKDLIYGAEAEGPRWAEAAKNVALWCLVLALLLAIGLPKTAEDWDFHEIQYGRLLKEAETALLVGALLAFTLDKSYRKEQMRAFREYLSRIEQKVGRGIGSMSGGVKLMQFREELEASGAGALAKELGRTVFNEYIKGLRVINEHDTGFAVTSTNWALESNRIFYDLLLECHGDRLEICVTHIGPPGEWLDENALPALKAQLKMFKSNKGRITRIFIGSAPKSEAFKDKDSEYSRVFDVMAAHKITTGYVQRADPRNISDMTWVPGIGVLMLWRADGGGGVDAVEILDDHDRKAGLGNLWDVLLRDAGIGRGEARAAE